MSIFLLDRNNRLKLLIFCFLVIFSFLYSLFSSSDAAKLLCFSIFHAFVIILPIISFSLLAYKAGIRERILLLCAGALGSGFLAYFNFWFWFVNSKLGIFTSISILLAMIFFIFKNRFLYNKISFFTPLIFLWFFYAFFILSIGMAPFGLNDVLSHVASRFSHPLPYDNQLPYIFAEQITSGKINIPMTGEWLSSDRPPLQTGYFLATGASFLKDSDLHYQICSTLLQCLWILPLIVILQKRGINVNACLSVLIVTMLSGFTLVHSIFTWPKMLPCFFLLIIFDMVLSDYAFNKKYYKYSTKTGFCIGGLVALAFLSHGGSIFALIGMFFGFLFFKPLPSKSWISSIVISAFSLISTWSAYQYFFDPPGNRLLKWHLAGVIPIDSRSFTAAIFDSYSNINLITIWSYKLENLKMVMGEPLGNIKNIFQVIFLAKDYDLISYVRASQFFHVADSLGIFAFASLGIFLFRKFKTPEFILGFQFFVISSCILFWWCLISFGPGTTTIHAGTLILPIFLYATSILILFNYSASLVYSLIAIHLLSFFYVYLNINLNLKALYEQPLYVVASFSLLLTVLFSIYIFQKHNLKIK